MAFYVLTAKVILVMGKFAKVKCTGPEVSRFGISIVSLELNQQSHRIDNSSMIPCQKHGHPIFQE